MKKAMIVACVIFATVVANAQESTSPADEIQTFADLQSYQDLSFERVAKSYLGSLEYKECNEIVECGLAQIAMLKLAKPDGSYGAVKRKIEELAIEGDTPAIRYKSYLTIMLFQSPDMFAAEKFRDYKNGDELFKALAERLQKEALATN